VFRSRRGRVEHVLIRRNQLCLLLASWTLATSAHASFGSFGPWDGAALLLVFALTLAYGLLVDLIVLANLFRHRAAVIVACIATLAVVLPLATLAALPTERTAFFRVFFGGSGPIVFALTSAVLLPFLFVAPVAQYRAVSHGRPSPVWILRWMALQPALLAAFILLPVSNYYYGRADYTAGRDAGRTANAGQLSTLLERAGERRGRFWGTGWHLGPRGTASDWIAGLAIGIDASALIATNAPLSGSDRAALLALTEQYFSRYAVAHVRAKLLFDALEAGSLAASLDPALISEETVPVLLERLEQDGEARLCPGGRMLDTDRAALRALVLAKGIDNYHEMRPTWAEYLQRSERLCSGQG